MDNIEIERKFLVISTDYKSAKTKKNISQGYLCKGENNVRIRICDSEAFLTIKDKTIGFARHEFEYKIPLEDAQFILDNMCVNKIEKTRYIYQYEGHTWEVDEFHGANEGLVIAEIELQSEKQTFTIPSFVGQEVTGNKRYYNAYLVDNPYNKRG